MVRTVRGRKFCRPAVLALLLTTGCRAGKVVTPPPPEAAAEPAASRLASRLSPDELVEITRRDLARQLGREIRVGYVADATPDGKRAMIERADTNGVRAGDSFLYFDDAGRAVALGRVSDVDARRVAATYDAAVVDAGRPVRRGDLAAFNLPAARRGGSDRGAVR